ncbi:MAG: type II toxin-antitoxin system RelE/ParE family toxin [Anaerolineae bacterium]|nr:type II toxin-antitoxin system RelE/ParE family toxin [Anaerolineae bacterium]
MIKSFTGQDTERLFLGHRPRRLPNQIWRSAVRKLVILEAADSLQDLRVPPGNHLEKLRGDRDGQYSIRVNDQWRICFVWDGSHAHEVEIADYH